MFEFFVGVLKVVHFPVVPEPSIARQFALRSLPRSMSEAQSPMPLVFRSFWSSKRVANEKVLGYSPAISLASFPEFYTCTH